MNIRYEFKMVVCAVIYNENKEFLLAQRSLKEDVLPGFWGIPGGKAETLENFTQNFIETEIQREVKEEVGITIKNMKYLENHFNPKDNCIHISFTAKIKEGKPTPLEDTDEVNWFSIEKAKELKLTPMTLKRLELAKNFI